MTPRERVEAALKHIEPDRTPIFEYVLLSPIADALLGRKYADYAGDDGMGGWVEMVAEMGWEKAVRQYAVSRVELAYRIGHDMMYVVPCPVPGISGQNDITQASSASEEVVDDPVERLIQRNSIIEQTSLVQPDEAFLVYLYIKEELSNRGMDLPILAPAYAHGVWTDVDLMQTMIMEPDVAKRHFTLATNRTLKLIEKYIALGLDQIGVGGDFAGNRLLISPQTYREFIVPEIKTLSRHIHKAGKWSVNASDGNLWEVIDDFLVGCEVDGYLEIDMKAGMDLGQLKMEYGNKVTLYGNMDCGNMLSFGTREEIRNYTFECLGAGLGNGGHIFCASNAITGSVPFSNYISMINAYREYFSQPKLSIGI